MANVTDNPDNPLKEIKNILIPSISHESFKVTVSIANTLHEESCLIDSKLITYQPNPNCFRVVNDSMILHNIGNEIANNGVLKRLSIQANLIPSFLAECAKSKLTLNSHTDVFEIVNYRDLVENHLQFPLHDHICIVNKTWYFDVTLIHSKISLLMYYSCPFEIRIRLCVLEHEMQVYRVPNQAYLPDPNSRKRHFPISNANDDRYQNGHHEHGNVPYHNIEHRHIGVMNSITPRDTRPYEHRNVPNYYPDSNGMNEITPREQRGSSSAFKTPRFSRIPNTGTTLQEISNNISQISNTTSTNKQTLSGGFKPTGSGEAPASTSGFKFGWTPASSVGTPVPAATPTHVATGGFSSGSTPTPSATKPAPTGGGHFGSTPAPLAASESPRARNEREYMFHQANSSRLPKSDGNNQAPNRGLKVTGQISPISEPSSSERVKQTSNGQLKTTGLDDDSSQGSRVVSNGISQISDSSRSKGNKKSSIRSQDTILDKIKMEDRSKIHPNLLALCSLHDMQFGPVRDLRVTFASKVQIDRNVQMRISETNLTKERLVKLLEDRSEKGVENPINRTKYYLDGSHDELAGKRPRYQRNYHLKHGYELALLPSYTLHIATKKADESFVPVIEAFLWALYHQLDQVFLRYRKGKGKNAEVCEEVLPSNRKLIENVLTHLKNTCSPKQSKQGNKMVKIPLLKICDDPNSSRHGQIGEIRKADAVTCMDEFQILLVRKLTGVLGDHYFESDPKMEADQGDSSGESDEDLQELVDTSGESNEDLQELVDTDDESSEDLRPLEDTDDEVYEDLRVEGSTGHEISSNVKFYARNGVKDVEISWEEQKKNLHNTINKLQMMVVTIYRHAKDTNFSLNISQERRDLLNSIVGTEIFRFRDIFLSLGKRKLEGLYRRMVNICEERGIFFEADDGRTPDGNECLLVKGYVEKEDGRPMMGLLFYSDNKKKNFFQTHLGFQVFAALFHPDQNIAHRYEGQPWATALTASHTCKRGNCVRHICSECIRTNVGRDPCVGYFHDGKTLKENPHCKHFPRCVDIMYTS